MKKSRNNSRYASNLAFLDILFNMVMAFSFLFLIAFLLIKPSSADASKKIKLNAEIILSLSWPERSFDDLDLWLQLPNGQKVNYRAREADYVSLDRDDRGAFGDIFTNPDTGMRQIVYDNREIMTIRAIVPGRYVVAAHAYATYEAAYDFKPDVVLPYAAKISVTKLNPAVKEVAAASVQLTRPNEARTLLAFTVNDQGAITNIEHNPSDEIVDLPKIYNR